MNIYLADDDLEDREIFADALTELPMQITLKTFQNGVELMGDLYANLLVPEAIFLDLKMPMMDGFECLADIRMDSKFDSVDVIIYSNSMLDWEVEKLKEMGANGFIQKPNSFNQLKTVIYTCLNKIKKNKVTGEFNRIPFGILK